jgi:hypothetical protein
VAADQLLFSYWTLQNPDVQLDNFGRILDSEDDVLPGFKVDYRDIDDPRIVDVLGASAYPVLRSTGNALDKVVGKVLWVTEDELDAADEYEVVLFRRASVLLASGRTAWVFVAS